jgi:hypothetical protein
MKRHIRLIGAVLFLALMFTAFDRSGIRAQLCITCF